MTNPTAQINFDSVRSKDFTWRKETTPLHKVPMVKVSQLTEDSPAEEAFYAYVHSPLIQSMMKTGTFRAHEPLLQLAKHFRGVPLKTFCSVRFASDWRDEMFEKLAGGTINGIRSKANKVTQWLMEKEIVQVNGWSRIARAPVGAKKRDTRVLSQAELDQLLTILDNVKTRDYAKRGMYGDIFRLSLLTGMRYFEIISVTASQVDFDEGVLKIPAYRAKTKTEREVVLCDRAVELMKKWIAVAEAQGWDRVFSLRYATFIEKFKHLKQSRGIEAFFHLGRHTAVTNYASQTSNLGELRAFSGHQTLGSLQKYLHASHNHRDTIRQKMNGMRPV